MTRALAPAARSATGRTAALENVIGVVLAGGLGTRLRPAIADRPKVLAPVGGRPFITRLLEQLVHAGIRRTVLLTGHRGEQVQEALGDSYGDMTLHYSREPQPLGTAGALRLARSKLNTPDLLLLNGDSYCSSDLRELAEVHRRRGADLSMVLVRVPDAARFGAVETTADGEIIRFTEKRLTGPGWINAGICLLKRELVDEIPEGRAVSLEREMIPQALGRKRLIGLKSRAAFVDIGTPESYGSAAAFFARLRP